MPEREQLFGTLGFSIIFAVWVVMSWAVFPTMFTNVMRANETSSLPISVARIVAVIGALGLGPPAASFEALHAWQKTGNRKFTLSVALVAILTMAFFASNRSLSFAYWL